MRTLRLHGGVRRPLALLLVGALVAAGCSSRPPGAQGTDGVAGGSPASVSVGGAPTVGPAPTQGPAAAPPSPSPGEVVATIDGVSITVRVDPNPVRRGEDVSFVATLRNDRGSAVVYNPGDCAFASLRATFPIPWFPTGRTWTGHEGWFKEFVLNHAYGPGAVAAWAPIVVDLIATPCDESSSELLMPGEVRIADFSRAVGSALESNPQAATMTFSITSEIDRQGDPPTIEPGYTVIPPRFFPIYTSLTAEGVVAVDGPAADLLTAGEAIDVLLENDEFATWLDDQEPSACTAANLFLTDGPPPDYEYVAWLIQLMCQADERDYDGYGWVDAETGDIVRLELSN
jgi:hypothetical protein